MPLGRAHWRAVVVVGLGLFFELYELYLAGVLSIVLKDEFQVRGSALPLLLGSAFLGMFLGSNLMGRLADIAGRKPAFVMNLLFYSVFTFLASFSPNVTTLIVLRFLAGIGIGGQVPLSDTYLSELLPSARRGQAMAWAYTIQFLSAPAEGLLARVLVPTHFLMAGWRWLFLIGGTGALFVWFAQRFLPESPRWLESVGRTKEAQRILEEIERSVKTPLLPPSAPAKTPVEPRKVPLSVLLSGAFRRRTIMLWVFHIFQTFGYYGFGTLVPLVLVSKGIEVTASFEYAALSIVGYPVGSLISVPIVERFQRKWLIVSTAFLMAVTGMLFGISTSPVLIVAFGFLYTLVSNIFSNAYHIFQAEIFPTAIRATAVGTAYSLSRLMSCIMPFILLPILQKNGATSMFIAVAAAMAALMLDVGLLGPRTSGVPLEAANEALLDNSP
jgi:putative MFS transporter